MSQTVLILDDERLICETIADYLDGIGHLVFWYASGVAALNALQLKNFTVAIVDMRLPDICGIEFIERAILIRPEMRYIIHTGSLECAGEQLQNCADGRIEAVLIKPVYRLRTFSDIIDGVGSMK
ncbi:response regulator [Nitratidesulfovibrio liaohensis]|uniref:Response regulator n=1 Tax=Nitratidesulfovibrio liaohensis TaxID=2604158 RepID=A0ABY9R0M6_9BACT|nr:response regulator [Nitratidesulfovibrio liaohensis]WMW64692.1 response regulator [Nitratidesulfovibrio liaohensis]